MHTLSPTAYILPTVDDFLAGDSRVLAFTVVDGADNPIDISGATVSWELYEREYQDDPADAVLTEADTSVEIVTDNRVDTTDGEFEVRLDAGALDGEWGRMYQRPKVEQTDGTVASWRGEVVVSA